MSDSDLLPCPFCGHHACEPMNVQGERWGSYDWVIHCSSSHCGAQARIIADGWSEQIDGTLNQHIPPSELYTDRLVQVRRMWNRRAHLAQPEAKIAGTDEAWDERRLGADERYVAVAPDQPEAAEPFGDADVLISAAHLLQRVMDCDWEESIEPQLGSAWVNAARDVILWVEEKPAVPVAAQPMEPHAWLIFYDDADRSPELFVGECAKEGAHARYKQISGSWNAHLFAKVDSNSLDFREREARYNTVAAQRSEGAVAEVVYANWNGINIEPYDTLRNLPKGTKLYLRPAPASGLAELAKLGSFQVDWTDDEPAQVGIWKITGSRNDREWHLVAQGESFYAAICELRGQHEA